MDNKEYNEHDHECGCGCHEEHEHDHECGCEDEEMQFINLTLDDGTETECGVIGVFEVEDKDYIALLSEDDDVLLYRFEEIDEESIDLLRIEDDAEFELVAEAFEELFDEVEEDEE